MRFLPRAPASLQPALAEAFRHLDLPEPVRVCLLRPPGATACYQVDDAEGGTHRLTILLADLDGTGVNGTLVAARRFEEVADLPVPHAVALPLGLLGCSAYLQRLPEGRPADTLGDADRALTALGRVLDGLGGNPQGDPGLAANPYGFRATADWASEWRWRCRRWADVARRGATAWQPLSDTLLAEIGAASLDVDGPPVLVPPDLEPGAVWLDDRGALCAVDGWDGAWCGDRWSAWAPLLHLPAQALHTVCMAFAKPPRLAVHTARLQAYAAGFVLRLLARASVAVGPHERVRALSRALLAADARRTLPERLLAADAGREGPSTVAVERSTVLAVMDRLVREPSVVDRERWLAVAGTALTAHHVSGTPGLEGWAAVAEEALAHLEPGLGPAVLPRGVKGSEAPDGRVVAWVAQSLRQAAGGWAPEGFDVAVAQLSWVPARKTGAQERLAAEVLALVAAERLGRGASPEVARAAALAWEELDFGQPAQKVEVAEVLRYYADSEAHAGARRPVGLLLFALARGGRFDLPAPVPALLQAMDVALPV